MPIKQFNIREKHRIECCIYARYIYTSYLALLIFDIAYGVVNCIYLIILESLKPSKHPRLINESTGTLNLELSKSTFPDVSLADVSLFVTSLSFFNNYGAWKVNIHIQIDAYRFKPRLL